MPTALIHYHKPLCPQPGEDRHAPIRDKQDRWARLLRSLIKLLSSSSSSLPMPPGPPQRIHFSRGGVTGGTSAAKHFRQVGMYISAPPIASSAVSLVVRRVKEASRPQIRHTAESLVCANVQCGVNKTADAPLSPRCHTSSPQTHASRVGSKGADTMDSARGASCMTAPNGSRRKSPAHWYKTRVQVVGLALGRRFANQYTRSRDTRTIQRAKNNNFSGVGHLITEFDQVGIKLGFVDADNV